MDSRAGIVSSFQYAFTKLGREIPTHAQLEDAIGPPLHLSLGVLLKTEDQQLIWEGVRAYRECYAELGITGHAVYDGLTGSLEVLKTAGASLFVATSKPVVFASKIIRQHGLSGFFQTVYGSELDGTRADKGDLIAHLLMSESLSPDTCVMIGDRKHDMIGAVKNGVRPVGVLWGYGSRDELLEAGAEQFVEHPTGLPGLVG